MSKKKIIQEMIDELSQNNYRPPNMLATTARFMNKVAECAGIPATTVNRTDYNSFDGTHVHAFQTTLILELLKRIEVLESKLSELTVDTNK